MSRRPKTPQVHDGSDNRRAKEWHEWDYRQSNSEATSRSIGAAQQLRPTARHHMTRSARTTTAPLALALTLIVSLTIISSRSIAQTQAGIAALYPDDVGIENHSAVLFTEQFEEPSMADVVARWGDARNPGGMLFTSDVPPGTPAGHALSIPWVGGVSSGGHLYKVLNPGVDDTLYVRYYVKYPIDGNLLHSGI